MNTVTKCSPARSRRLARIAMAFAVAAQGASAGLARLRGPTGPREARPRLTQQEDAPQADAQEDTVPNDPAIDTRIEAYGAVYERRLLCTVAANGSVSRVAGRPVVQRSLARSFADPLLTPAPGCAGTRHMCR